MSGSNGRELIVRVADLKVGEADDFLVTIGLGSCVAIILHDPAARVGGLAHVLLPSPALSRRMDNPAKAAQTAVPLLLEQMARKGASPRRITGRIAGGASMFASLSAPGTINMGESVTDHATFAYLCDVYVLEAHRGHGLGKRIMREVMAHAALTGARRIMLATRDAHGLYRLSGFTVAGSAGNLMEVVRPDPYRAGTMPLQ